MCLIHAKEESMSMYELETKLDEELNKNKKDCDRFVVEDICTEILSSKNTPTRLIKKIYEYIDNGLIELWGSFPYDKLRSHNNSPFNIFAKQAQYDHITDILFMSYITDTPEAFFIIANYLRKQKNSEESIRRNLDEMWLNPSTNEYKTCLNSFRNDAMLKSLYITKKHSNKFFHEEILKMRRHLRAGYNLFSKVDELLFDFKLPIIIVIDLNEYDYWRIVFYIKLSCSEFNERIAIVNHLQGVQAGNMIDDIAKEFVSSRSGFFTRNICPKFYKQLWINRVKYVRREIIGYIT